MDSLAPSYALAACSPHLPARPPHLEMRLPLASQHQLALRNRLRLVQRLQLRLQPAALLHPLRLLSCSRCQLALRLAQLLAQRGGGRGRLLALVLRGAGGAQRLVQPRLGRRQALLQAAALAVQLLMAGRGGVTRLARRCQLALQPPTLLLQLRLGGAQRGQRVAGGRQLLLGAAQRPRLRLAAAVQVCGCAGAAGEGADSGKLVDTASRAKRTHGPSF